MDLDTLIDNLYSLITARRQALPALHHARELLIAAAQHVDAPFPNPPTKAALQELHDAYTAYIDAWTRVDNGTAQLTEAARAVADYGIDAETKARVAKQRGIKYTPHTQA